MLKPFNPNDLIFKEKEVIWSFLKKFHDDWDSVDDYLFSMQGALFEIKVIFEDESTELTFLRGAKSTTYLHKDGVWTLSRIIRY